MISIDNRRRAFWHLSCREILSLLCAAAIPVALGVYTATLYKQDQEKSRKTQELRVNQTKESRQDSIYDQFLNYIYNLDKDGYLNESEDSRAFANAYYRAAHRQLDPERKADVLQFLKEKKLIGRNNFTDQCRPRGLKDIIHLNGLNFDHVHFKSQTSSWIGLNLECILFDQVSMSNAIFFFANLNGVSFDQARLDHSRFGNSSLICTNFNKTTLREVNFEGLKFENVTFSNLDVSTVTFTEEQKKQSSFYNVTGLQYSDHRPNNKNNRHQ